MSNIFRRRTIVKRNGQILSGFRESIEERTNMLPTLLKPVQQSTNEGMASFLGSLYRDSSKPILHTLRQRSRKSLLIQT